VAIQPVAGTGLTWAPDASAVLELENISIFNTNPAVPAFLFDGTGAGAGQTNLRATNCLFGVGAVLLRQIVTAQIQDSDILSALTVEDCGFFLLRSSSAGNTLLSYDGAVAISPRSGYIVSGSALKQLLLNAHPLVKIDPSSRIGSAITSSLTTFYVLGRDYSPDIEIEARCDDSINLSFAASQVGPAISLNKFDFSRGEFIGPVTITSNAASPRDTAGFANGATFRALVTVNNPTTVCDARSAEFFTAPAGTGLLDRTFVPALSVNLAAPVVVAISPPLSRIDYVVATSPLNGAVNDVIVTLKTTSSYTLTSAGAATVDALLTLP
jgi:hypothetical protein